MANLVGGLGSLAARAAANRRLTGSAGLLGGVRRAAGSYARQLRGWFTTPRDEALVGVRNLARGLQRGLPPVPGTPPPVVPGLAKRIQQQEAAVLPQRVPDPYSPATMALLDLTRDILGRSTIGDQEARELGQRVVGLLRMAKTDPMVQFEQRRQLGDLLAWLEHRFQPPTAGPTTATEDDEDDIQVLGRADIGSWTDRQIADAMKGEIRTSGSSNVYSFMWTSDSPGGRSATGGTNGTLFVTFKAWHPGMSRKRGGTGGARPDSPGPTYAYSNVPLRKYQEFEKGAEGSAGGAVWDYLRVRGSRYGHQHPYRIVAGVPIPGGGEYVPRKALASGFRGRTLVNPRSGTRVRSQLEDEVGGQGANYSYAQWREIAQERNRNVDRGRPSVDRGRP